MPTNARDDGQQLLDVGEIDNGPARMVEAAVRRSLAAAARDGLLGDLDAGAGALACGCARAVDAALVRRDPYAVAAAARELRETLTRLRLEPTARGVDDGDGFGKLLRELSTNDGATA